MYSVIRQHDYQAFDDLSPESGKNFEHFIMKKPLWHVPIQSIVVKKKKANEDPCEGERADQMADQERSLEKG